MKAGGWLGATSDLSRVPVFARQQRSAQLAAVAELGLAGLDLGADPLVVLLQQLHRGDVAVGARRKKSPDIPDFNNFVSLQKQKSGIFI